MKSFKLQNVPNQVFTVSVNGNDIKFHLCTFRNLMYVDVTSQDDTVVYARSLRCVNKQWLLPYPAYIPEGVGNFRFEDSNGNYPWYENLGLSCNFVYYSPDEIAQMQG